MPRQQETWRTRPGADKLLTLGGNNQLLTLIKGSLMIMRCPPEDIISRDYGLSYEKPLIQSTTTYGWTGHFCQHLNDLIPHAIWLESPQSLAIAIQYAVVVDTGDDRPFGTIPSLLAFDTFIRKVQRQSAATPDMSYPAVHRQMRAGHRAQRRDVGFMSELFAAIEELRANKAKRRLDPKNLTTTPLVARGTPHERTYGGRRPDGTTPTTILPDSSRPDLPYGDTSGAANRGTGQAVNQRAPPPLTQQPPISDRGTKGAMGPKAVIVCNLTAQELMAYERLDGYVEAPTTTGQPHTDSDLPETNDRPTPEMGTQSVETRGKKTQSFVDRLPQYEKQAGQWMKKRRPGFPSLHHVKRALPLLPTSETWTTTNRDEAAAKWQNHPLRQRLLDLKDKTEILTLYKSSLVVMSCFPEDIIGVDTRLEYDVSTNKAPPEGGLRSILWSGRFCAELT